MGDNYQYSSKKIAFNFVWKLLERGSSVLVSTLISIVLARILNPEDFGLLTMISVFVTISNVIVTGGVGDALIQKKDSDILDFSSLFWMNLGVAITLYLCLFLGAPLVANFYQLPELTAILRVLSLNVIILSINTIQCAYIAKNMLFRNYFYSTLSGKVISGAVGIVMAFTGFGVWALVAQSICLPLVETIILWFRVGWRPTLQFSWGRAKNLYSYAWKVLVISFVAQIRDSVKNLIVGRKYSASDLAFFHKGEFFPNSLITNISTSISTVIFPALSDVQDDTTRRKLMLRRWAQLYAYCGLSILTFLFIAAEPITRFLLTDKWLPSVPYMHLACLAYMAWIVEIPIRESIKSLGKSGACLIMQIIKTVFILVAIFVMMNFGVLAIAYATVIAAVFNMSVSSYFGHKYANYSPRELLADTIPSALISVIAGGCAYLIMFMNLPSFVTILLQFVFFGVIYLALSHVFKFNSYVYLFDFVKKLRKKA